MTDDDMALYCVCFAKGHTLEEMSRWSQFEKYIVRSFIEIEAERLNTPSNEEE